MYAYYLEIIDTFTELFGALVDVAQNVLKIGTPHIYILLYHKKSCSNFEYFLF